MKIGPSLAACAALFCAAPAAADDATIIVNRSDRGVELFVSAPSDLLFDLFQAPDDLVPMKPGGGVDFAAFQQGTWGVGDAMLANAPVMLGDDPAQFEAMSFMLHPSGSPMPFDTPIDALVSIGVCNVIPGTARYSLEDLSSYVGFYAHQKGGHAPLHLHLPSAPERAVTITVKDFGPANQSRSYEIALGPDSEPRLTLAAADAGPVGGIFGRAAFWISQLTH